jgi:ABC-type multidrug transport system fused ATPase/permease subunit
MKLILRFYDVTSGQILIDGNNIKNLTQHSLRGNIATVFQDPYLFNDTIKFNIAYGRARASLKKIEEAAELSNADTFIRKLKDGYKTVIGERGVKLSGGEQQRISIARAIIKDAPIIILDEATSSLDSESELLIQDALFNLTQNKTTLIIAHRLSTVMRADLIAVVDKGKITEIGTHKDLVAKKGIYAKLFEIQSGGYLK